MKTKKEWLRLGFNQKPGGALREGLLNWVL